MPSKRAEIAAEQSGTIVEMPVAEGEAVEQDQVLFKLSSKLQELRVQRLEALCGSSLTLRKALATLEHAETEMKRLMKLSAELVGSGKDLQDRELEAVLARLEHQQAQLDHTVTTNDMEQARVLLEQRTVVSPFSGIVTEIFKRRGETSEKLVQVMEIATLDPLWVEFECPITDENLFRPGTEVVVSPAARKNESRTGTVVYVSMTAKPSSHTFRVRIATPNKDHTWKAGLKMLVRLPEEHKALTGARPK